MSEALAGVAPGRRRELAPFAVLGVGCVVAGGLVAAATAPAPSEHGSWAAAYLVLVAGVAQVALGVGQSTLAAPAPSWRVPVVATGWNAGNAAVIAGTLSGVTGLVDVGGGLLVATLALLAHGVRGGAHGRSRLLVWGYRALLLVLLVSIPVGLVLARLRG